MHPWYVVWIVPFLCVGHRQRGSGSAARSRCRTWRTWWRPRRSLVGVARRVRSAVRAARRPGARGPRRRPPSRSGRGDNRPGGAGRLVPRRAHRAPAVWVNAYVMVVAHRRHRRDPGRGRLARSASHRDRAAPALQRAVRRRAAGPRRRRARLSARPSRDPGARRLDGRHGGDRRRDAIAYEARAGRRPLPPRGCGRGSRPGRSPRGSPLPAASSSRSSTPTSSRRGASSARRCRTSSGRGGRPGAVGPPQPVVLGAHRRPVARDRRPLRGRAVGPRVERAVPELQRDRRDLATGGHPGRRRLGARHGHRGSRPQLPGPAPGVADRLSAGHRVSGRAACTRHGLQVPAAAVGEGIDPDRAQAPPCGVASPRSAVGQVPGLRAPHLLHDSSAHAVERAPGDPAARAVRCDRRRGGAVHAGPALRPGDARAGDHARLRPGRPASAGMAPGLAAAGDHGDRGRGGAQHEPRGAGGVRRPRSRLRADPEVRHRGRVGDVAGEGLRRSRTMGGRGRGRARALLRGGDAAVLGGRALRDGAVSRSLHPGLSHRRGVHARAVDRRPARASRRGHRRAGSRSAPGHAACVGRRLGGPRRRRRALVESRAGPRPAPLVRDMSPRPGRHARLGGELPEGPPPAAAAQPRHDAAPGDRRGGHAPLPAA